MPKVVVMGDLFVLGRQFRYMGQNLMNNRKKFMTWLGTHIEYNPLEFDIYHHYNITINTVTVQGKYSDQMLFGVE